MKEYITTIRPDIDPNYLRPVTEEARSWLDDIEWMYQEANGYGIDWVAFFVGLITAALIVYGALIWAS